MAWWFNRIGRVAQAVNPRGGVPPYGLVTDVANADWSRQLNFDAFISDVAQVTGQAARAAAPQRQPKDSGDAWQNYQRLYSKDDGDDSFWDNLKQNTAGLGGFLGDVLQNAHGAIGQAMGAEGEREDISRQGVQNIMDTPGVEPTLQGLDTVERYAAAVPTALRRASMKANRQGEGFDFLPNELFDADVWEGSTDPENPSFGQGVADIFVIQGNPNITERELVELRKHDTGYNLASGLFDIYTAWKVAPEVVGGYGLGSVRAYRRGQLPMEKSAKVGAKTKFRNAAIGELTGKQVNVGVSISAAAGRRYGRNLSERMARMRVAAQEMDFEDFAGLYAFRTATNGPALAYTMRLAAQDDNLWDLTTRASLGDAQALKQINDIKAMPAEELKEFAPNAQTFVDSVEASKRHLKGLEQDIARTEKDLLARQQSGNTSGYFRYNTWLLETDLAAKQARLSEATDTMARYEGYDEWLQHASTYTPGTPLNAVGGGSSFWYGKDYRFFHKQDSPYSKRHTVARVARAPFLKKPGVVDLHRNKEGYEAVRSYFDQLQAVTGYSDVVARNRALEQFAGLTNDVQRKQFMESLETGPVVTALTNKLRHTTKNPDLSEDVVMDVLRGNMGRRDHIIGDMAGNSQNNVYRYVDDDGNLEDLHLPVDATQLQNYYATLDLQAVDAMLRRESKLLHEMDTTLKHYGRAAYGDVMNSVDTVGRLFNHVWKPAVLLRLGWPARVIPDEAMRVAAQVATAAHLPNVARSLGVGARNVAFAPARAFYRGKQYEMGAGPATAETTQFGVVAGDLDVPEPIWNQAPAKPIDDLLANPVPSRIDRIRKRASERDVYKQQLDYYRAQQRLRDLGRADTDTPPAFRSRLSPEGDFFHGTSAELKTGDVITPAEAAGRRVHAPGVGDPSVAYATPELNMAENFSDLVHSIEAPGTGKGNVYRVRPEKGPGDVADDPNMMGSAVTSPTGFRVVGKIDRDLIEPATPSWAKRYASHVKKARENGDGFTFDPATDQFARQGYAVQAFPDRRLSVPGSRFGVEHLNYYAGKNADALATRGARVSAKYDAASDTWQLDVVRHFRQRELQKALEFGARVEADGFIDVGDSMRAYARELNVTDDLLDDVGQRDLTPEGELPRVRVFDDIDPFDPDEAQALIDAGEALAAPVQAARNRALDFGADVRGFFAKREIGQRGTMRWSSADGKTLDYEPVYSEAGRVYMTAVSSNPAFRNMATGYDRTVDMMRASNAKFTTYKPPRLDGDLSFAQKQARREYYTAWQMFVNDHVRFSPIWKKMLEGQTNDDIVRWMYRTAEGRELRRRMPYLGYNPEKWVSKHRVMLDEYMPSNELRRIAHERDVTTEDLVARVHLDDRPEISVPDLDAVVGGPMTKHLNRFISKAYRLVGTLPTDRFIRHPFAKTMYEMKMRNFIAQNDAEFLTDDVLRGAEREAREFALDQVKRTLFNLADDSNFMHFFRFMMPFTNAWQETMVRWARIGMDHPEALARLAMAWDYLDENFVVDVEEAEGRHIPFVDYHDEDRVVARVPKWLRDHIPGAEYVDKVSWTKGNMNLIFQGEYPLFPSASPMVSLPADWGMRTFGKHDGFTTDSPIYKWLFPIGRPDKGALGALEALSPGWARRVYQFMEKEGDSTYQNYLLQIANVENAEFFKQHGRFPNDKESARLLKQAKASTEAHFALRILVSFASPVSMQYRHPYQMYADKADELMERYGHEKGYTKFIRRYGTEFYRFAESLSASETDIPATKKGLRQSVKFQDLIAQYPEFGSMIVSPDAYKDDFDYDIYKDQFERKIGPGSNQTHRSTQSYFEFQREADERLGWWKYMQWRAAVDAEMVNRGVTSLNASAASDLAYANNQFINTLADELPSWGEAYASRPAGIGARMNALRRIAFDNRMTKRPDMQGLRQYIKRRDQYEAALNYRYAHGGSRNLQAQENADLALAWDTEVAQMKERNPMFADLYNRWLENDNMETGGGF